MKTRIVSSLALAAAIALGATGCGLIAPQGTTDPYAPSDGIDLTVDNVDVRNLILVAAQDGENFNVVFTGVNRGDAVQQLSIEFTDPNGSATATASFSLTPGSTAFGHPQGSVPVQLVSLPGVVVGSSVTGYVQLGGGQSVERDVPVLDGTLKEYEDYVVPGPVGASDLG